MIEVKGLQKSFGTNKVLCDITFEVERGDIFGIVGTSGAGKSTLLRCLNGLEDYQAGSVRVMGREVRSLSQADLKELRREMGMIFQTFNLMMRKNVSENIAFPLEVWKTPKSRIDARVSELLELVGLSEKRRERIGRLSGGQKQRVGIARALALSPAVLLCDEATSALDPKTTISILGLLRDINERLGLTMIVVTHQMEVVKLICNKMLVLVDGQSCCAGLVEDLFLAPPEPLKRLIADEYAVIPSGVNIRLMFPRHIANESVVTTMARELGISFSIVGGRIDRYRDTVMGFLIVNVPEAELDRVLKYLEENKLFWEVMTS